MIPGEINMPHCCPYKQNFEFIHGVRFRACRNKYMYGISVADTIGKEKLFNTVLKQRTQN
jgi:hypothetical protein